MRRLVLAFCLAASAGVAQAQTFDDRFPKPSRDNPSLVTAVRHWFAAKAAASETPPTRSHPEERVHAVERTRPEEPAPELAAETTGLAAPAATAVPTALAAPATDVGLLPRVV